jgi:hypothetical protein
LKASYIKAASFSRTGSNAKAIESLESTMPILNATAKSDSGGVELRTWTEQLLTLSCILFGRAVRYEPSGRLVTEALSAFRLWASFWDHQSSSPPGGHAPNSMFLRRHVWKEYYATLSTVLQHDMPYPIMSMTSAYPDHSTRLRQRAELRRIETKYEGLLLKEVQFPKAEESSEEVEEWVDLVMENWAVLCGSGWQDAELGKGGRESVSRDVLNILYSAAKKTFHSTSVLRHLFTVHLAVAEFDLAFKAFETYLEIVKKGKARVDKTGEEEKGLDSDETVLETAAECIQALCRYGSQEAAGKARDIGKFFEEWLLKHYPEQGQAHATNGQVGRLIENGSAPSASVAVSPRVFAIAWRSIGISQAQWARVTYEAAARAEIQLQAIASLRKSLSPEFASTNNVDTHFALALVLAERRELSAAIDVVKAALLPPITTTTSRINDTGPHKAKFSRERSLIPLWHLLALLLSARQDFNTAARSCEGAFEQFQDPKNLFGEVQLNNTYRSEHLNRLELHSISEKQESQTRGVIDEMDDLEKETVLEVKITQLALIEVMEGPDVAVNASDELLSLYSRLFGELNKPTPMLESKQSVPPQSSSGTLRSIKGSIFGRSKRSIRKADSTRGREPSGSDNSITVRPQTSQTSSSSVTRAPTIHVTNENGGTAKEPHHHEKLHKNPSLTRKKSQGSVRNRSTSASRARAGSRAASSTAADHPEVHLSAAGSGQFGLAVSSDNGVQESLPNISKQPLASQDENVSQKDFASEATKFQTDHGRSFFPNPVTRFPKDQERRRRTSILVKVWLLIAGFYRRAEMFEDSKGAVDEAYKLVEALEGDVSRNPSSGVSFANGGWGSGKSVEELWGDVLSEVCIQSSNTFISAYFQ